MRDECTEHWRGISPNRMRDIIAQLYGMKPARIERFIGLSQGKNTGLSWGGAYVPDRILVNEANYDSITYTLADVFFFGELNWSWWFRGAGITATNGQVQLSWQNIDALSPAGVGYEDLELGYWANSGTAGLAFPTTKTLVPYQMPYENHKSLICGTYADVNVIASGGQLYAAFALNFDGYRFYMS